MIFTKKNATNNNCQICLKSAQKSAQKYVKQYAQYAKKNSTNMQKKL